MQSYLRCFVQKKYKEFENMCLLLLQMWKIKCQKTYSNIVKDVLRGLWAYRPYEHSKAWFAFLDVAVL